VGTGVTLTLNNDSSRWVGGVETESLFSSLALTGVTPVFRLEHMEVNIGADLQAKLARLAAECGRDTQALVQEAIEKFVDHDEWFLREVEKGLTAADRGELIDHEDIGKLINRRYPG
jgi:predicted transcriptional regulator